MIKVIWNIVKKIFGVVFLLLSPLKRLWCRRKRRTSDPILPIANHYPSVENLNASYTPVNGSAKANQDLAPWDTWEEQKSDKVRSVEEYRQWQQMQRQQSEEPEVEPDYFQDMAPTLKKQKKVLVRKKDDHVNTGSISNKLAMATDVPFMQTAELGSWEEENNAWEDEAGDDLSWEADNVIREKRKLERQQRQLEHQKRKQEREQQRQTKSQSHLSAVRL